MSRKDKDHNKKLPEPPPDAVSVAAPAEVAVKPEPAKVVAESVLPIWDGGAYETRETLLRLLNKREADGYNISELDYERHGSGEVEAVWKQVKKVGL